MLLSTLEQRNPGPVDDFWYRPVWWGGTSKEASPEQALGLSAWWNGIAILAGTMGSLPCRLYRRVGESRQLVHDDPRGWMMFREPNEWQTAFEWREMAQGHLLTRGNHYSRKIRDRIGRVIHLVPLHPDRVELKTRGGAVMYRVRTTEGIVEFPPSEILHLRGLGGDGLTGYSVVGLARRSLGYALSLEGHGAELMGNKARPGGVLSTDQVLNKEHRQQLSSAWDQMFTGGGIGKTAVIDAGLTWQQVGFSAEDAQFIESRKFQIMEVARWLNIPPHFLKDLERSTFSNIEHQGIEFVTHTIRPWVERWEQRLDQALLEENEREELFFKFSLEALLRGDSEGRAGFYQQLFQMAALSPNEIRSLEDMNPVEGGDQRFVQLNLVPLEMAGDPLAMLNDSADRALENRALIETREARSLRQRRRLMQTHRTLMQVAAGRLVQREVQDLRRLLDVVEDVAEFLRRLAIFAEALPETVRQVMGPLLRAYLDLVADAAAEEVELDEVPTSRVTAWREAYIDALARGHTSETTGRITDTMTKAQGDPFDNVRAMLDRWEENRAASIAMRETITAGGGMAATVYAVAGFGAIWRTVGESCPYCKLLNGRTIRPGGRFMSAGDTLDPEDGETEPMTVGRNIGHPQAHDGCDCFVSAWRA